MILIIVGERQRDHIYQRNYREYHDAGYGNEKKRLVELSVQKRLGWTLVWAFLATFLNYFFGIILAMLINKKGVKFKSFYRTLFVLAIAVPLIRYGVVTNSTYGIVIFLNVTNGEAPSILAASYRSSGIFIRLRQHWITTRQERPICSLPGCIS